VTGHRCTKIIFSRYWNLQFIVTGRSYNNIYFNTFRLNCVTLYYKISQNHMIWYHIIVLVYYMPRVYFRFWVERCMYWFYSDLCFFYYFYFCVCLHCFEIHIFTTLDIYPISHVAIFLFCCTSKTNHCRCIRIWQNIYILIFYIP